MKQVFDSCRGDISWAELMEAGGNSILEDTGTGGSPKTAKRWQPLFAQVQVLHILAKGVAQDKTCKKKDAGKIQGLRFPEHRLKCEPAMQRRARSFKQ